MTQCARFVKKTLQTTRTAVYGPVRTMVWQGSAGDRRPYADQTGFSETGRHISDSGTMSRMIEGDEDEG